MNHRGLTLIELLAVITLITLTTGVTLTVLSGGSTEARLRAVAAEAVAFDAHARRLAERHRDVALECADENRLRVIADSGRIAHLTIRHGASVQLLANGAQTASAPIDRLGRSVDYEITIQLHGRERCIAVAGLTGWTAEATP